MHDAPLLQDLAVVMIVAGVVTLIFHRLRQPVVLGYIVAGAIIGPHTPPFLLIRDEHAIKTLSDLGVIFLMFSLGLEFSFRKLKQVGGSALIASVLEILLMAWVGYEIGRFFGWKQMDSIFLGAILSISSTTIIVKALEELGLTKERFAELIFGILIFEDILGILIIALLSGVAKTGALHLGEAAVEAAKLAAFMAASVIVGVLTVPRLLRYVGHFRRPEMLLITTLALCFVACVATLKLGYSVALGAFMMGAIIAEAREIGQVEELMEPIRDMFSAVFFVSIGLLIDPKLLWQYAAPIAVITIAVVLGKVLTCSFGSFVAGQDLRTSLRVGMGLAQIGEFSFIIAALGMSLGVTSEFLYPIAVTVSALTTLTSPYLIRASDPTVRFLAEHSPPRLRNLLDLYTRRISQGGSPSGNTLGRRLLRKWAAQMILNLLLVSGIFAVGAFVANSGASFLGRWFQSTDAANSADWFLCGLLSLPFLIATYRKLQAFGMLVAEMKVRKEVSDERQAVLRAILANGVLIGGIVLIGLLLLVLSSAILQSGRSLWLLLLLLGGIAVLLRRTFVRVYSKGQIAVQEVFSTPPRQELKSRALSDFLAEAELERMQIVPGSEAANKLIRELQLRTRTGASIVAIRRNGQNIFNPEPNEELLPGDHLLVIGTGEQLSAARLLCGDHHSGHPHATRLAQGAAVA
jgi:CPA2 family monovalent cation:H+ antiporter-2